ncbi:MAG: T9SS type A sorting domain-containing protein [Bacteroidia bacterium]|nr:T9SS type A sorting domain-containing protein [Bacteroidia bacterium]
MKRLIHIAILLVMPLIAFGQGFYRLGDGFDLGAVKAAHESNGSIVFVEVLENEDYGLKTWDGFEFIDHGAIDVLPKHGVNADGNFEVLDAIVFEGDVYVLGQYDDSYTGSTPIAIAKYDGNSWSNVADQNVQGAYRLTKFVEFNNKLHLIGIFRNSGLLSYEGGSMWVPFGNVLGSDKRNDFVHDVNVFEGRMYATGEFTQQFSNLRFNLGVFANGLWEPVSTPPFLHLSKDIEVVGEKLYVSGEANHLSDYLKTFDGLGWDDVSKGLEDIEVFAFWDLAGHKDLLCLSGIFEERSTGKRFNFLLRDKNGWKFGESTFILDKEIYLLTRGTEIYAYGDFHYGSGANVGELTNNFAMLSGKLFLDKNDNCIQEETEEGLGLARIVLSPGDMEFITNRDGSFDIPISQPGNYSVSYVPQNRHTFGCGKTSVVTVTDMKSYRLPELTAVERPNIVDLELGSTMKNGWKLVRGEYNEIRLTAANRGTTTIEGASLTMKMGDWWEDVSIVPSPTSTDGDMLIWKISDLEQDEAYEIIISGTAKSEIGLYNDFCYTGEVDLPQVDIDKNDNRKTATFETVDELGPISKDCSLGEWYDPTVSSIQYTIRFKNETDKVVNNVYVEDTFDKDLISPRSIDRSQLGSSLIFKSKNLNMGDGNWRFLVTWRSSNAGIQPQGATEGADVGTIQIEFLELHDHTKNEGTELCNYAKVKLSNQEPIKTNTICSKSMNVGLDPIETPSMVQLYPNPAQDMVTLENNSFEVRTIEIYDQLARVVRTVEVNALSETDIDLANLTKGVYFVKVVGFETKKLIVQ